MFEALVMAYKFCPKKAYPAIFELGRQVRSIRSINHENVMSMKIRWFCDCTMDSYFVGMKRNIGDKNGGSYRLQPKVAPEATINFFTECQSVTIMKLRKK
ncbi:MAG TPA: hypothetical protein DCZ10_12815 [Pelotomaculum sp.]|nr:hypothetical protein [Pelotomaculum sp.]